MRIFKPILLILFLFFMAGCAAVNPYPLKNQTYFNAGAAQKHSVVILPASVNVNYNHSYLSNTREKAEIKYKQAKEFFSRALRNELSQNGFIVMDEVPGDAFENDGYEPRIRLDIVSELIEEYNSAYGSIMQNLKEEKGEGFDYSIGIRVEELNATYAENPDIYVIAVLSGFVFDLTALEDTKMNKLENVLSLGMSKMYPVQNDGISVEITFIDAQNGSIIWIDNRISYGKSVLLFTDIDSVTSKLLDSFSWNDVKSGK